MESRVRRTLAKLLSELWDEIEDGMKYGIPHIVGEINPSKEQPVDLSIAVFENARHSFVIRDEGVLFMYPAEESNPKRLFFEVWRLIEGKSKGEKGLEPGLKVRGPLEAFLQRKGFSVLWMNVRPAGETEQVEVWATKGGRRFSLVFQRTGTEYLLADVEEI